MKQAFRRVTLLVLIFIGGYSVVVPNAHAFAVGAIIEGAFKLGEKIIGGAKTASTLAVVKQILDGTGKLDAKLGGLKDLSKGMSNDIAGLWKATDQFYKDLKKISQGVETYRDMLRLADNTRAVYGYCGSAVLLSARSPYLTLDEHEYVLTRSVEIQEYVQKRIQNMLDLVTSSEVSMNDYERMQLLGQIADEQQRAVVSSRSLVAKVKGLELRHQQKAKDRAFRDSFLNMKL
ncbi:hypothetical protein [Porphyromonas levii]|uniref:Conjugal transfer protein TraI n=1 Tax=Porphyromonas levii TaxID=28114 RepID=A0A4Y8WPJ3_9PORP|nr:hypothetical protein [Porphyromonas levii]MBR8759037.1 hypothetical protein [Porphyromonas levii]TFH94345.1 hypothetical protein E4P47_07880 [Porphyromonas levii]TFH96710.1 hypothetical protein E4P48_03975 [Porphyromonas levii]